MKILLVGTGRVAFHLGHAMVGANHHLIGVVGRNTEHTDRLSKALGTVSFSLNEALPQTDIILIAVSDDAIADVALNIPISDAVLIHTSGASDLDKLLPHPDRAVLWPLMSLSPGEPMDFKHVPIVVDGNTDRARQVVRYLAESLSVQVSELNHQQRELVHAAAAISLNFPLHLLARAQDLLKDQNIDPAILLPSFLAMPLSNLQYIIKLNTDEATKSTAAANGSNANQIATARILKAYFLQYITDRWGDIPYSEALKGVDNFSPAFDTQQAIYNDLFKELKEAQSQFDAGKTVVGDILLSGNVTKWKKFANSLRLIAALRLSKVDPAKGKTEFAAALADGVIAANADNVKYTYLSEANNEHPLYNNYITTNRKDYAVSSTFVNTLVKLKDPRLPAMAEKNINGEYRGVPYGVFPVTWKAQDVSLAAPSMRQQNSSVNVITYAQVLLAQAEAAALGWTSGNAKDLYEAAIKASLEQWGVYNEADYKAYIAQPDVAFTSAKAIEQISVQRWIALFYQGSEAWAEWRRTGFPVLTPAANPLNGGKDIPRRMAYPATESNLNKTNYNAVVTRQGKDDQYTRVWWDK